MKRNQILVVLAVLGVASNASALTIDGGPFYAGSGGVTGTCTLSGGNACLGGGATVSCTGLNTSSFQNLYYGIRNDQFVSGLKEAGSAGPVAGTDQFKTGTASITYTGGSTTLHINVPVNTNTAVNHRLVLTMLTVTGGTATATATGGNPADNANSDIDLVFALSSGVTAFTMRVEVLANFPNAACLAAGSPVSCCTGSGTGTCSTTPATGGSCATTFNPASTTDVTDRDVSRADFGFYFENVPTPTPTNTTTPTSTATPTPTATATPTQCGNGTVDAGEDCDEGGNNGASTSCCTSSCLFRASGETCRPSAGVCDLADTCDGASATCGADLKSTAECRPDGGECDVAESCDGVNDDCPADGFESSGFGCGDSSDTECTNPDTCDGNNNCLVNDETNGFPCGDSSDTDCTDPDTCDGSGSCQDNHEPITTVCRAASLGQECDEVESCDGAGNCPADGVEPNGTLCRGSAGICDIVENCDGVSSDCPADALEPASTSCRVDSGDCDVEEFCPGNGPLCPADAFESSGTSCGDPSDTVCDNPDTCDGNNSCESNNEPNTTECRAEAAGQECDEAEQCDGAGNCPADGVKAFGTLCRADAGECDVQEVCDGIASDCPFDTIETDGTPCGSSLDDVCTNADDCQAGVCDPQHEPAGTLCRAGSPGQLCDEPEECDGAGNCPADAPQTAGTECRAASAGQECDEAEECDGVAFQCPADGVKSAGTLCRAQAGGCDAQELCNGTSSDCPTDAIQPFGTICRADAGECDVAEQCDGVTKPCPADAFEANGTTCTDDGEFCSGMEECQNGSCVGDGDPCTVGTCDEDTDQCLAAGCESAPLAGCVSSLKSILVIKDKTPDTKDKLIWKWLKGTAVQSDFADPVTSADYTLCIYTAQGLVSESVIPPGGGLWSPISTKGYKYKDKPGTNSGITKIILKGNQNPNKAKALVKGKGINLDDIPDATNPALDLDLPVKVQLVNEDNGNCFEADYGMADIKKNEPGKFKAKKQ